MTFSTPKSQGAASLPPSQLPTKDDRPSIVQSGGFSADGIDSFQEHVRWAFPSIVWYESRENYSHCKVVHLRSKISQEIWSEVSCYTHPSEVVVCAQISTFGEHGNLFEFRGSLEEAIESLRQYLNSLADSLKDAALPPVEAQP